MKLIQVLLIVFSAFPLLSTLLLGYQLFRNGQGALGKPTITPWLFYPAKLSIAILFAVLLAVAIEPEFSRRFPWLIRNDIPLVQKLMSVIFLVAGNAFLIPAYYTLSIFTRVGLPESQHIMKTDGIYRISRNPMYLSLWLFFAACWLIVPSLLLALPAVFSLIVHHFIILSEEKFMERSFGDQYLSYKSRVARYL